MQTQDPTSQEAPGHADDRAFRYDTDLIKSEGERLLSSHFGRAGTPSGARVLWTCPRCGKEGKLALQRSTGAVGCWNAACEVPDTTDVIGLIANLEGLQTRGADFKKVAALCHELLGLPDPDDAVAPSDQDTTPLQTITPERLASSPSASGQADPETTDRVIGRLLELCPLEERDERLLASRGVALATARAGRFGSISADRAAYVVERLEREFGHEVLLDVPGFREDARNGGRLGFTLWGDFLLIPYLDARGHVSTIEGLAVGEVSDWAGKYTTLRGGGNHLYVFPTFRTEDVLAICEGPMGAIVAAQEGIPVGAIQGLKRYKATGEQAPLPELASVDFDGRGVLYVADADVKPEAIADVEKHAPRACEWLVSRQNGVPRIATVPRVIPGTETRSKDLDEWMLAAPEAGYEGIIRTLLSRSATPEDWTGIDHAEDTQSGSLETAADSTLTASSTPENLDSSDRGSSDEEAPGEAEFHGEVEPVGEAVDAIDRWHAVVEECQGPKDLIGRPEAYRAGTTNSVEDGIVPSRELVESEESEWAGLLGFGAAVMVWYFLGACIGWVPGPFGWLPDLPDPVAVLGGIPAALTFGLIAGVVVLAHLRGLRLAKRAHLLGQNPS